MLYEKVKRLAAQRGVSIQQMEQDLGFSSSYISKWRVSSPSAINLQKVANYLDVTMEELMEDWVDVTKELTDQ